MPFLVPLHAGGPVPANGPFYSHWYLDPTVALFVFGVTAAYLAWVGPLHRRRPGAEQRSVSARQVVSFLSGSAVLLIALGPPMDDWAHFFLVSAHMVQHLLLMLVVPPLWLAGIPAWVYAPLVRNAVTRRIGYALTRSLPALALPSLIFIIWHVPVFYDAALGSELLHALEHQMFLFASLLTWWPILGKVPAWPRLHQPLQCLYLFLLTIPGGIVGSMITFANPGLYSHYDDAPRIWGLNLATDQEIAGLLMWVGTNTLYLLLITIIFFQWAAREEAKDAAGRRQAAASGR